MDTISLAQKALRHISDTSFPCSTFASEGGKCGDGWDFEDDLYLLAPEIIFLLKGRIDNAEVFNGFRTRQIDVEEALLDKAYTNAFPEGVPMATVEDTIPYELEELAEQLGDLDVDDEDAVDEFRTELEEVETGDYTFSFSIANNGWVYEEGIEETIYLTQKQALGLLRGISRDKSIFDGLCKTSLSDSFLNRKANEMGLVDEHLDISARTECDSIDGFLEAWVYVIDNILSGNITEDTLDSWLEYFDDGDYMTPISEWYKKQKR